jgi:ABC-type uncharacterized transport system substrate-binding protein
MKTNNTHRLTEFALTLTGADHDESSEGERCKRIELFRSRDGSVFADLYNGAIRQTWPVQSKTFSQWLARTYFETANKIATQGQLKAAINQIEAQAQLDIPEREVFHRVGEYEDRLYLDLADEKWSAVEIDATGWRVVQNPPVRFVRTPGTLALPVPEKGGSIETLRSLVNVGDEHDFILVVAWLLAAMHRQIAKPVLAIRGGEGSAKSTLMEILRGLIDPHCTPSAAMPTTDLKLRSAAAESYCRAYDNVSGLKVPMSDALCRFVTDGSNQPVIINGISDIITRPDLADRCLFIDCAPIPDVQRRTQADVMTMFARTRPQLLGVVLGAVGHGLRQLPQIKPSELPRMADFALAMFWPAGTFRMAYDINRAEIVDALIEAAPVASAVRLLVIKRKLWEGQASDLDNILRAVTGNLEGAKNWPADPRILANTLRQLAPSLMKIGIDVKFHKSRDHDRKRLITITASNYDAANKEDAILASAASATEKQPSEHREDHTDSSGDNQTSGIPNTPPDPPTTSARMIVTAAIPAAFAAKGATQTVPIVFECGADPVRIGLVDSLNRPGGNITGIVNLSNALVVKRVEVLHEIVPNARTLALLLNPDNQSFQGLTEEARRAQIPLGINIEFLHARTIDEIDAAFAKAVALRVGGLIVAADAFFTSKAKETAAFALREHMPTSHEVPEFAVAGGLMSYGADLGDAYRLAGLYAARVLKGEKPAELPVQQTTKVKMTINLKSAKALGLTVPLPLLGRADEVIE